MTRVALQGLADHCDSERAVVLTGLCAIADRSLRRAIFYVVWPCLSPTSRMLLAAEYAADFEHDPFLQALAKTASAFGPPVNRALG